MARNRKILVTNNIQNQTIFISMFFAGFMAMLFGLMIMKYPVDPYLRSSVGFFVFLIGVSEIGLKKFTKISRLKKLQTQQYISLTVYLFVLVDSITHLPQVMPYAQNLFLIKQVIQFASSFTGGTFFFAGLFIIIETFR